MKSKKDRRNSGRQTDVIYDTHEHPYEIVRWDDWNDWRDGFRFPDDKSQIRSLHTWWSERLEIKKHNEKLKKLLKRRKAMKDADSYRNSKRYSRS